MTSGALYHRVTTYSVIAASVAVPDEERKPRARPKSQI